MTTIKENKNLCKFENDICYSDIESHLISHYCVTYYNNRGNGCTTILCCPVKLVLCLPCHLGVIFNCCVNGCCCNETDKNYLF